MFAILVFPALACTSPHAADQYRLQSQLVQQQLDANLQRQLDQSRQQMQLQQQVNGIELQSALSRQSARLQEILSQQLILNLETQRAAPPQAATAPTP
ncbi:MAG: hypothetical protein KGM44_12580 [bacterium]|nr:hypothetical protein [bacterium]